MTKRTRNILIAVIGILALAAVISIILNKTEDNSDQNIIGTAEKSAMTVIINDTEVPAYDVNGQLYIVADNLQFFGLSVEYSDDGFRLDISSQHGYTVEADDAQALLIQPGNKMELYQPNYSTYVEGIETPARAADGCTLIPLDALGAYCTINFDGGITYSCVIGDFFETEPDEQPDSEPAEIEEQTESADNSLIIVLDPGHGKSSGSMSSDEKEQSGWTYNSDTGSWGEWRHFKYGTSGPDCWGDGCSHRVTPNGACWYPIGNGDRDTEPAINLNNCLAAKAALEQMGYTVRLTRESNEENPSITRRLTYCYPNNDTSQEPDAAMFVCVHSNAGGGSGSSYISLEGPYDQPTTLGSSEAYTEASNTLGRYINDEIGNMTLFRTNAPITFEPELIAFCKAPVICGYLEIGFFDNSSDLQILNSSSDSIGRAIASGIDKYVHEYMGL